MSGHDQETHLGRATGAPHEDTSLSAYLDAHPDAEAPRLYAVSYGVGGVSDDYLSRADLLRVLAAWQAMLLAAPE